MPHLRFTDDARPLDRFASARAGRGGRGDGSSYMVGVLDWPSGLWLNVVSAGRYL